MATVVNLFPGGSFTSVTGTSGDSLTGWYTLDAGAANDSAALATLLTAGARKVRLGAGTFVWRSTCTINFDGIHIEGAGTAATIIQFDDAGGLAGGDGFLVNSVLNFSLTDCTITSNAARSAGAAIKVLGKNNITASPVQKTQQYVIRDVNMDTQFNGVVFNNSSGGDGAWGGHIDTCQMTGFAAGGVFFDVNSPAGGQHYIRNIKIYGDNTLASANRPLAAVRYRGGADLEMVNVNAVYLRYGLLIDPPNAQSANVTVATACLWDNMTLASVLVQPAAGGTVLGVELNGGWGYTPAATSQPTVQLDGGQSIEINGGKYWGCFQAVKINGATHVAVSNIDCSGSTTGIYATNSSSDFKLIGNTCGIYAGVTPTTGILVDAGCDHYTITGNTVRQCTTPMTITPVDSATRRLSTGNITL